MLVGRDLLRSLPSFLPLTSLLPVLKVQGQRLAQASKAPTEGATVALDSPGRLRMWLCLTS